jgi:hypothetical protein
MTHIIACLLVTSGLSCMEAGTLEVTVKDLRGQPVSDAVVYAKGNGTQLIHSPKQQVIDQQNKQFVPYVTAVQVGTAILYFLIRITYAIMSIPSHRRRSSSCRFIPGCRRRRFFSIRRDLLPWVVISTTG